MQVIAGDLSDADRSVPGKGAQEVLAYGFQYLAKLHSRLVLLVPLSLLEVFIEARLLLTQRFEGPIPAAERHQQRSKVLDMVKEALGKLNRGRETGKQLQFAEYLLPFV